MTEETNKALTQNVTISNKLGLHARAAAKFVRVAQAFQSEVFLAKDGETVDGKSIMDILLLAAEKGTQITLTVNGSDQNEAFSTLKELIEAGFGE
ncbi:MAG: HPr family phosphocarrier protein [bacterium]|nr:HPr family phosphocarrier protein [bacterium]MBU1916921.1 HPr family phosphocarrier protein [bacterium]